MLDQITTTINGLVTIRALRAENHFLKDFHYFQDNHTTSYVMCISAARAFGFLLEIVYLFYMILVVIMLMIFCDGMGGGTAGLILNTTMGLMVTIQYAVRNAADLENQMTSVERILEYSELESEESPKEADSRLNVSPDWPLEGSIHFQDVCLTYENSTNETLIEINCQIKGGERVGIVGRTGAGKSSLLAVLFRMHRFKGRVTIDGTDITTKHHFTKPFLFVLFIENNILFDVCVENPRLL
ncbi:unnamed protein product, partial [Oppiella nova]